MNGLMMLEQQLAAVVSAPVSLPLGLAASACAALVVAALLLQSIVLRQRRTKPSQSQRKTEDHAAAMVTAAANGFHAANGKEDVQGGIPSADRLFQLISTRRSVFPKDFNGKLVSDSDLQLMLEAANWAPTHGKTEPWRFVVLDRASALDFVDKSIEISKTKLASEEYETKRAKKAEMMKEKKIPRMSHVVLLNLKRVPNANGKLMPEWEDMAAVACAVQNMQLMATSLGVACYWSSWWEEVRDSEEYKAYAGLDSADRCMGALMVGKSDNAGGYRASRGKVADKVQWRRSGLANGH